MKFLNFLKTLFTGSIVTGILYAGLIMNLEWAANLSLFMVWLLVCIGGLIIVMLLVFLVIDDSAFIKNGNAERFVEPRSFFSKLVGRSLVVCNIIILVSNGYFVAGAFYTFIFIAILILHASVILKAKRILGVSDVAKA